MDALIVHVGTIAPGKEPVFKICHHPGAGSVTRRDPARTAEVDGVHVTGAGVVVGLLSIPVVEATTVVEMRTTDNHVLTLRLATGCSACRGVIPITDAGIYPNSVNS